MPQTIDLGGGYSLLRRRILCVAPYRRNKQHRHEIEAAVQNGKLLDATGGRKRQSIVYTDDEWVILSALEAKKLEVGMNGNRALANV